MEQVAGWIAPIATVLAAMMTAANLGPRITGWGFALFGVGAVGWCTVALLTHQPNLLWTNGFLLLVDIVGVWRWLGRAARLEDGAKAATTKSERGPAPALFPVASLQDRPIEGRSGDVVATVIGAMAENISGRIAYLVVRIGGMAGINETLRVLDWRDIEAGETFHTHLDEAALAALRPLDADDWPGRAPARA